MPTNPTMQADPVMNPLVPTGEQWSFVYQYYPDYQFNPVDIILWLYETATFNEEQAQRMQNAEYADSAYNKKPVRGGRKVNPNKKGDDDSEEENQDTVYFNKQTAKKPVKPQVVQKKELTAEEIEKRKQKEAEKQAAKRQKEAKSIKQKVQAVADEEIVEVDETK